MSSLTILPLPKVADETSFLAGWDETIEGASWQSSGFRPSLAAHAVAHQSVVCGTCQPSQDRGSSGDWISWTTSFAPNRVCRVASNHNGSVVAVATDGGNVSILRGADGKVIATRRVAPDGVRVPAEISFIVGRSSVLSTTRDALVIEPPEDGPPILVSNIDGDRLNSANPGSVSEAARSMSIQALDLVEAENIRSLRGCFVSPNKIRFALVDGDGQLAIQDYSIQEKHAELVQSMVDLGRSAKLDKKWEVDYNVAMSTQELGANETYLVLSTYCGTATKVCWFDLENLTVSCELALSQAGLKRNRVEALEPVLSCSKESCLAVAVATSTTIQIVQVLVDKKEGKPVVSTPHVVYTIPLPQSVQSLSMAPLAPESGPYSFRCKYWLGVENHQCGSFITSSPTQDGSIIGAVRMSVQRAQFDQAYQLVRENGADILIGDGYARFHPSEISLMRLKRVLANGNVSNEQAISVSRECLQQLASGALSGNDQGRLAFLAASDMMIQWPTENATQLLPTISEIVLALSAFIAATTAVINAIGEGEALQFVEKNKILNDKLMAMKYIDSIVDDSKQVRVTIGFGDVRSPKELFACLVEHGYFLAAEQMWRSNLRSKMTTEAMVSSMLVVTPKVDPRNYANLLQEVILPSLTINHELLPPLLAWSCGTADAFDDEIGSSHSLDKSIFLLGIMDRATKALRARVHTSFASYSPFVGKTETRSVRSQSTMDMTSDDQSFLFSVSSPTRESLHSNCVDSPLSPSIERPNPTILKMGSMKGGAQKSRLGQLSSLTEAVDEGEVGVELKLHCARLLKQARHLGLHRRHVSLRTFSSCGGAQYIAKELVRSFSGAASSHEERMETVGKHGKHFCEEAGANFDDALLQYANELCKGETTSREAIQEASSIARCCSSAEIKCRVTLVALRAALFCRYSPTWLSKLSLEAIQWASGDSALRSELEESSRLLLIDGIVGRYCGEGAKELFRVDNPRHAARLLEYVSQHIYCTTVLSDVLDLCEAFTHLSQENACSLIMQHAVLEGANDVCCSTLESLYVRNVALARTTFAKVMAFISDLVGDCSGGKGEVSIRQRLALLATACACEIIPVALPHVHCSSGGYEQEFSSSHFDEGRLEDLLQDYGRIRTLQIDHSVFLSLSDLHRPDRLINIISHMFDPIVEAYAGGEPQSSSTIVTRSRRACSLLAGCSNIHDSDLWCAAVGASACRLAWQMKDGQCIDFLSDLGVLESTQDSIAARACISVALALCLKASQQAADPSVLDGMKFLVMAASLLQDHALLSCPNGFLSAALALGELADIVGQVLVRTDEGFGEGLDAFRKELHTSAAKKRWSFLTSKKSASGEIADSMRLRRPVLHSSWYVGDGLLLPPVEALSRGIEYCKYSMGTHKGSQLPLLEDAGLNLHYFLEGRGSHSLAVRLLCNSTVTRLCSMGGSASFDLLAEANQQTSTSLLERYLGGAGNGITSGLVDSQLAVSFLLGLPVKQAFKVYRSSLPTAISTRDFTRVGTLANVGKVACSQDISFSSGSDACFGWKKQHKFAAQCKLLATRALWWGVLQEHHVEFDPHRFEEAGSQKKSNSLSGSKYAKSLVPTLIANLSSHNDDTEATLDIVSRFSMTFGLSNDLAIQKYIEFLLSPVPESPVDDYNRIHHGDIRRKLYVVEVTAKSLLRRIESPLKRASILRSCTIYLEKSNCGTDYERLSLVFALYQEELGNAISQELKSKDIDPRPFLKELELTDRRRDALAILSSYFQGERKSIRPSFSSFFLPLNGSLDGEAGTTSTTVCHILGREVKSGEEYFDPLDPLESILRSNNNVAAGTALAPLCLALGVPRGYIHARSLIARFTKAESEDVALPSFESDVLPVINRLNASADKADLAEWCSARCDLDSEGRLKCLDLALKYAMQASSEAERFGGKGGVNETEPTDKNESKALERVKRIRSMADMFADRSTVNAILRSGAASAEKHGCLTRVIDALILKLETEVWCKHEFIPEEFIDIFLSQASLIAAEASLNGKHALSMGQFRNLSLLVHQACKSIADKYSHVQVGSFVRRLTRRWLFHGDHHNSAKQEEEPKVLPETRNIGSGISLAMEAIDEDDTMNFIMDLTNLGDDDNVWSADIGTGPSSSHDARKLTSEEEPSSLRAAGSARESSELESRRAALRIAFVMAFAEGYYSTGSDNVQDENSKPAGNLQSLSGKTSSKSRGGLLGRIVSRGGSQRNDTVMDHSKELLHIVFAKSGSSDWIDRDLSTSLDTRSFEGVSRSEKRKIITFAMRHRALRAASILCPQEALEEVATAEGYIGLSATCTLKKCSFGVFVAKEIEEMGLPLPHSDLTQLSTMHFPSYARTLWRYHRDSDLKGSKGRLLLLILEMYLKERVTDAGFVVSILTEMGRLNLPRTILLACERIGSYKERHDSFAYSSSMEEASSSIAAAMASLSNMVLSELRGALENGGESAVDSTSAYETVYRLGTALQCFCDTDDGQKTLESFAEQLLKVTNNEQVGDLAERVCDQVVAVLRRVKDKANVKLLMEQVNVVSYEGKSFSRQPLLKSNLELSNDQKEDIKSLSGALARLESSLDNFTHSVV